MSHIRAVLFDLDGTLLDTAPDLLYTINYLRQEHGLAALSLEKIRPIVSLGSKAMVKLALGLEESNEHFNAIREYFLKLYQEHLSISTTFFPDIEKVLTRLEEMKMPWGIVTNKLARHTAVLLKKLALDHRAACIVSGDTLPTYKPHPGPILHACKAMALDPKDCLYIGDCVTDVMASKAAGTKSLVALYGYIGAEEDPYTWQADGYVSEAMGILEWIDRYGEG